MSTVQYLAKLNGRQLEFARQEINRLIRAKDEAEKVTLWVVQGSCVNEGCFYAHEFDKAKQRLADYILGGEFRVSDVGDRTPQIVKVAVLKEEVESMMEMNSSEYDSNASQMNLITENSQLEIGRDYWVRTKRATMPARTLKCGTRNGVPYLGCDAFVRWDIIGPTKVVEAPDFDVYNAKSEGQP